MKNHPTPRLNVNRIRLFLKWYKKQPFNQKASLLVAALVVLVLPLAVANVQNAIRERSQASSTEVTCETGRLTEDFSGSELDLTKYATSGAILQSDNKLSITATSAAGLKKWSTILTNNEYSGDFYIETDFIELATIPENATASQVLAVKADDFQVHIQRRKTESGTDDVESNKLDNNVWAGGVRANLTTSNLPVKVKIERVGTQFKTYYKTGTDAYTLLGNYTTTQTGPIKISLQIGALELDSTVTGTFDNLLVRCNDAPQSGASPTPTPTPDLRCKDQAPQSTPDLYQINLSNSKATLYFTPAKAPIGRYVIEFGENGQMQHSTSVDSPGTSGAVSATVNALKPNTTYTFRVQPINGCQPGSWSNNLNGTTTRTTTQNRTAYKDGKTKTSDTAAKVVKDNEEEVIATTPKPTVKASVKPSPTSQVKPITNDAPIAENPEYVAPKPLSWWERIVAWFVGLFS